LSQRGNTTLTPACQQHMSTMLSCRTDVSNALSTSAWFRFPYPFQWGIPTFHWETAVVMMVSSVIASVDSVSFQYFCNSSDSFVVKSHGLYYGLLNLFESRGFCLCHYNPYVGVCFHWEISTNLWNIYITLGTRAKSVSITMYEFRIEFLSHSLISMVSSVL
jgi:hypothetical protein